MMEVDSLAGHTFLELLQLAHGMDKSVRLGNEFQKVKQYDRISSPGYIEHRFLLDHCVIAIVEEP